MWERTLSQKIVNKLCEQDVIDTCDAAAYFQQVMGIMDSLSGMICLLVVIARKGFR